MILTGVYDYSQEGREEFQGQAQAIHAVGVSMTSSNTVTKLSPYFRNLETKPQKD